MTLKLKTEHKDKLRRHKNEEFTLLGRVNNGKHIRILIRCNSCGREKWSLFEYFDAV